VSTGIVWFRKDLRLGDNLAWSTATRRHDKIVALFIVDPYLWERCSTERVALLAAHLRSLDTTLAAHGGRLRIEIGSPEEVMAALVREVRATEVIANADVSPYAKRRDTRVAAVIDLDLHHGTLIHAPGSILTHEGARYRVFGPFFQRWFDALVQEVPDAGTTAVSSEPGSELPPTPPAGVEAGEEAARRRLAAFDPERYPDERSRPDLDSTSRLSIDLKYGTLSPLTVHRTIGRSSEGARAFIRQLAWREFHAHLLDDMPHLVNRSLKPEYDRIEWNEDEGGFEAWKQGQTGYPLVDAGMRQLDAEGWIHNRVRMVASSFLVKDLLIDWRRGERWFRRRLLDGDISQNVGNWQWVAGSGADAAPYFRIFNPVTQSKKFDPQGDYIRRWVPELVSVPSAWIHEPWRARPPELASWGAGWYPGPIVDHAAARDRTLASYQKALSR
jgi:deoxyribodipyrimidine photo-lyase